MTEINTKLYTSKTKTKKFLHELNQWLKDRDRCFPHNNEGDILLVINPVGRIYKPYIAEKWEHGGLVDRIYFKGLDFLKDKPVRVVGTSQDEIDYYNPCNELDLRIVYSGKIPIPLKIICFPFRFRNRKFAVEVKKSNQFNKEIRMHVDAYELESGGERYSNNMLSYIWLPHPTEIDSFRGLLPEFIHSKINLKKLEEVLINYYSNLSS